jgi:hypothetical protein
METNHTRREFILKPDVPLSVVVWGKSQSCEINPHDSTQHSTPNFGVEICQHGQIKDHGHFFADFVAAAKYPPRPSFPISVRPVEILTLPFTPPRPFKGRQIDTLSPS